jgi:DNA-binding NarL/FixJ family response regulator
MLRLVHGAGNKDIARELGCGLGTVHWHLDQIFKKLDVHSRAQACRMFAGT